MGYSRQVVSLIDFEKAAGGYQGEEDRLRLFDRLAGMGYKEISRFKNPLSAHHVVQTPFTCRIVHQNQGVIDGPDHEFLPFGK